MPNFWLIFFSTFALEDAALVLSLSLVHEGSLSLEAGFLACFLGISVGDMGLYGLGYLAQRFSKKKWPKIEAFKNQISSGRVADTLVVVSRAMPGSRLPIYFAAGYFEYPILRFFILTILSVFAWVALAFAVGQSISGFLNGYTLVLAAILFAALAILKNLLIRLLKPWSRRALKHSWRRWMHFEFWPAWLFYIPVIFYVAALVLKYRSFKAPLYANPEIKNGGLVGESKWDFLKYMRDENPWSLRSTLLADEKDFERILQDRGLRFPLIFKPDRGQRGYGVRVIADVNAGRDYLEKMGDAVIVQEYCPWENEVGVFYQRYPGEAHGRILSITDKKLPQLIGDGKTKLGELILLDPRARIIADTYFARFQRDLDRVPERGEAIFLTRSGNHCQGAIFLNGIVLKSSELESIVEQIAKEIPNFYFGRMDLKYESKEFLMEGKSLKVIEVNGAGSEMTHIWDAKTPLMAAYRALFIQWSLLFETGRRAKVMGLNRNTVNLWALFKDAIGLMRKNKNFSTSS